MFDWQTGRYDYEEGDVDTPEWCYWCKRYGCVCVPDAEPDGIDWRRFARTVLITPTEMECPF